MLTKILPACVFASTRNVVSFGLAMRMFEPLIVPGGVSEIPVEAFSGCESLWALSLTDGVRAIGREAFAGCEGLDSLALPASVEAVGEGAG